MIPVSSVPVDDFSRTIGWGPMSPGDTGETIGVWAWPYISIMYTGYTDNLAHQDYPIVDLMGTVEGPESLCWGPIYTFYPPKKMFDRLHDPIISGDDLRGKGRVRCIYPIVRGSGPMNKIGILLFVSRPWGFRS